MKGSKGLRPVLVMKVLSMRASLCANPVTTRTSLVLPLFTARMNNRILSAELGMRLKEILESNGTALILGEALDYSRQRQRGALRSVQENTWQS